MKYENAKDILPNDILKQVQKYAQGLLLYVPIEDEYKSWGEVSGYRQKLIKRNQMICHKYVNGMTVSELADEYFLSLESIKKIIYSKKNNQLRFDNSFASALAYAVAGMAEEWIQSYLMYDSKDNNQPIDKDFLSFGVAKIPLRLIQSPDTKACTSNAVLEGDEPLIVRFEQGKFYVDYQKTKLSILKANKVHAYPAFIVITDYEEYKRFMNHYGKYFVLIQAN